jgi:hypothetical protein
MSLVRMMAENREVRMPITRVVANPLMGPVPKEEEDQTRQEGGNLSIENGRIRIPVSILDGRFQVLTGCQFFPDPFINQHVGIHRHTDGQHNTCNTREGEHSLQMMPAPRSGKHVGQQCNVGHQTCPAAVVENHVRKHHHKGDQEGIQTILAQTWHPAKGPITSLDSMRARAGIFPDFRMLARSSASAWLKSPEMEELPSL